MIFRTNWQSGEEYDLRTVQALYLYNRGLINFGSTLAAALADVNPGAAKPQALGVDTYNQMQLYLIPDGDLESMALHLRNEST